MSDILNEKVGEAFNFTFQNGSVVQLRRVSPLLMMELQSSIPLPEPPKQEVETGDGKKRMEPNLSSPEYLMAIQQRDSRIIDKTRQMIVKLGVVRRELSPEEQAGVNELRKFWIEELGQEIARDDWEVFVNFIAVKSQEDLEGLIAAVMRRSQPTEVAIQQNLDSFRNQV